MRAIVILSTLLLLGGCSNLMQSSRDLLQSLNRAIAGPSSRANASSNAAGTPATDCYVSKYLIAWGREYKEASGSGLISSYSITTDQGQLHVDDTAVYNDIMANKGKEILLQMSAASGGWIVDLPGDSQRNRIRSSVMCHPLGGPGIPGP
ncbi:hypothetical protein DLM_0941 [Aquitalea magnusonii]|uniref:Lipoprotein n=1 Tax=Aquitalea magnusonii TaxID=332411 RepID=A0A3G9GEA6_9NEIS|nr:hypothetical protein [Aquitalea magnusonii]BBF84581.1 hypothetical protein DLM_0941 [Aquitalea magnusonii]